MHATLHLMQQYGFPATQRGQLDTLQVNLGYRCNQSCLHCHVNASPQRSEMMSRETVADVLAFLEVSGVKQLDLTGGAPELNAHFRGLVMRARETIQRFGSTLVSMGKFNEYMALLRGAHRDDNVDGVMCRSLLSVDWQGYVYDCDFNQMLGLPLAIEGNKRPHLSDLIDRDLRGNPIAVRDHC